MKDEYAAFCLDEAVAWLGSEVEFQISQVVGKTPQETRVMQERILERILKGGSRFADPVAMGKVKSVDSV